MGTMHCLKVGCADATVIVTATATFLVDCANIGDFSNLLPASKKIRSVFITHQHEDHYSGLRYLKDNGYTIDFLIYSPYERRYNDQSVTIDEWNEFNALRDHFVKQGTETREPYRQDSFDESWWATNGLKFWIVGPHKSVVTSDTREIHDASLVIKADMGDRHCCFTGDASDTCLEAVADDTKNYCNDILHASHHGSLNGAHLEFIKKANAKYTVISTESAVYENVPHPTALRRYSDNTKEKVYRTDNGSIKWTF